MRKILYTEKDSRNAENRDLRMKILYIFTKVMCDNNFIILFTIN